MYGQKTRRAEYFERLYMADPPTGQFQAAGLQTLGADPSIDEATPSLEEVRRAVADLRGGKGAWWL